MDLFSLLGACARFLGSLQFDDSSISLIALLAGMVGGYRLTGWHDQFKAKRARITRKGPQLTRKPE